MRHCFLPSLSGVPAPSRACPHTLPTALSPCPVVFILVTAPAAPPGRRATPVSPRQDGSP
ncbi:hypothetical protein FM119_09855 [Mycetocola reblochoni REB411]|uniref:Uncharacterized protein n=1 Tax=Mycetocola reblochoni REB411 TaxID=1255698 RepID=A0A1R4JW65_9MICO|nr:hypothetical protein FM119_09855 [Mycetocola reblochoni REB411]